ncbi:MAG: type II toxin-antitoxin system ParD family antitoxin [Pseudomonadales bacterium]|nr:type II toxin-antitoxin system ParD family antitoxin [Pseudomonadales bacterium]
MPMVKKSITVTDKQEAWVQTQMAKGYYASDSEIFRELIRERQMREAENTEIGVLRAALIEAEQSIEKNGYSEKTVGDIMQAVLKRKGLNSAL